METSYISKYDHVKRIIYMISDTVWFGTLVTKEKAIVLFVFFSNINLDVF